MSTEIKALPGFRRTVRITPSAPAVCAQLEDDYHCMSVTVRHDGNKALEVKAMMHRAPWTTCPGAEKKLSDAFFGLELVAFARQAAVKRQNCTHLFDLAVLAAAHVEDKAPCRYEIYVSDAVDGIRHALIERNGQPLLSWQEQDFVLISPEDAAGTRIDLLKTWIATLDEEIREAAKLLQWANILANGRSIPLEQQSDASKMPAGCYTFQPERAVGARRVGEIVDFSRAQKVPLEQIGLAW